jgi:hypothetical protein
MSIEICVKENLNATEHNKNQHSVGLVLIWGIMEMQITVHAS